MLNFFWPQTEKANPTGLARLGRALHLLGGMVFLLAATGCVIGLLICLSAFLTSGQWVWVRLGMGLSLMALAIGSAVYLAGRGLRFVLSGE